VGHSRRAEAQPPFQPFSRLNKEQGPNSGPLLGVKVAVRKDGQGTHYWGGGAYHAPSTPSAAAGSGEGQRSEDRRQGLSYQYQYPPPAPSTGESSAMKEVAGLTNSATGTPDPAKASF